MYVLNLINFCKKVSLLTAPMIKTVYIFCDNFPVISTCFCSFIKIYESKELDRNKKKLLKFDYNIVRLNLNEENNIE